MRGSIRPFEKSVTLIHGKNGAGKSSLLSAIVWCLTGHVYRAQRLPETVETPVVIRAGETDDSEDAEVRQYDICAITPLPPREVLDSLGDEPVPLDTAVELSFVDDSGAQVGSVTRAVKWTSRGKVEITEPDFSSLALEPMAREVGTRMPGLIPYIQLGVSSDLGMAVSSLTGIKPLEDVVQHASKSKSKLEGDLVRDRKGEIASLDGEFTDKRRELEQLIDEHPEIGPGEPVPLPSSDRSVEETLGKLAKHFDAQQAMTLRDAQSILGDAFDPRDKDTQQDLFENLGAAIVFLDAGNLRRLPSAARLHELGALDDEQLAHADSLIQDLASQAGELAALSS